VLQQRVAAHAALSELLSFRLLLHLMNKPVWWLGIASMTVGSALGGWALQLGSVTLVEPLLSANLLFALIFAAALNRVRIKWHEVTGAVLVSAALGVFIAVAAPEAARVARDPDLESSALAGGVTVAVVLALVTVAKRRMSLATESVLIATGAGLMYGLQDTATRATFLAIKHSGWLDLFAAAWPYVIVATATFGILLSQSAFRAGRLDYSLPPTAAAEPITGIALGISVLGDRVAVAAGDLAVESICLVAVVAGAALIARSGSLRHAPHLPRIALNGKR
jgi:hypothetical protein